MATVNIFSVNMGAVAPTDLPANISYNTQGALDGPPLDVSNNMNQYNGNVELQALSHN
ncbi:hypothetical protein DSO57_1031966 [Entomophthora muscae]|uniref:Uncharacterized protein n=1 Tax=Entomophthora muscae TaxID=34485 RepID=A0ACC2SPH5_9FUNG|nr:hypothetical protein DSO57_1031966 [Entomophthora muscae]